MQREEELLPRGRAAAAAALGTSEVGGAAGAPSRWHVCFDPCFAPPPAGGRGASRWALSGAERDAERGRELVEWAALEDVDLISEGFLPGDFLF